MKIFRSVVSRRQLQLATLVLTILIMTSLFHFFTSRIPIVDAQALLIEAYGKVLPDIDSDQVWHSKTTVYQRTNPNASEPLDPYHQSVSKLLSDTYEVEYWVRGGGTNQQRSTARDSRSGQILFDHLRNGDFYGYYNVASGYAFILPHTPDQSMTSEPPLPFPEVARRKGLKIIGTTISAWDKLAWVIQTQDQVSAKEDLTEITNSLTPIAFQRPYLMDLTPTSLNYRWIIDQESGRMVSYEWWAITASGPVLIERIENRPPEIVPLDAVPADWLAFPPEGVPVRKVGQASVPGHESTLMSLEQAVAAADFNVFLPDVSNSPLTRTDVIFKPQAESREVWQDTWRFDIQDASTHGLALEVIYLPERPDNDHALAVIQGPSERLVPLMRETIPIWTQSHPVRLTIDGQETEAWVASGGTLDSPPKRIAIMLELQKTFLFIVGQGYPEEQVLDFVSTLHPVD